MSARPVRWCGFAHHFILGYRCRYHLATFVGDMLVSSVGALVDDMESKELQPVGSDPDEMYELMVFRTDGDFDSDDGCPRVTDWLGLLGRRFSNERECNDAHNAVVACLAAGASIDDVEALLKEVAK